LPPAAVRDLTDTDFEAVTQAATGQTTGRWLVQFYAPHGPWSGAWQTWICGIGIWPVRHTPRHREGQRKFKT